MMSMRGSCIVGMVSEGSPLSLIFSLKVVPVDVLLMYCSDGPADVIERDSRFVSGEKSVIKADSPVNR